MEFIALGVIGVVGFGVVVAVKKSMNPGNRKGSPTRGIPTPPSWNPVLNERILTKEEAFDLRNGYSCDTVDYITSDTMTKGRYLVAYKDGSYTYATEEGLPRNFFSMPNFMKPK